MFSSIRDVVTKITDGGQTHTATFRKTTAAVTTAGIWFDGSNMGGHPITNFYASTPLLAANLPGREGIQNGSDQAPAQKHLKRITAMCSVAPTNLLFIDTLLYYPFIDGDSDLQQDLDNSSPGFATLQRYTDGAGVKAFLVAQGAYVGGVQFFFTYTNENGVSGRISQTITTNTAAIAGSVASSSVSAGNIGWSIPLQGSDRGIRSIQSCQFITAGGGIFALVLCKDLSMLSIRGADIPAEKDFLLDSGLSMPEIEDGAFLSFLVLPSASIANAPIYGNIQTVWG